MKMRSAITLSFVPEAQGGPFVLWGDLAPNVALAKQLGFDAVEIFPPGPEFFDPASDSLATVGQILRDQGMAVAAVGTGAGWVRHRLSLADPSPIQRTKAIEFIQRILDAATEFQAPAIIGSMQGRSSPDMPLDRARGALREALERLDEHAANIGGAVLYEPLNRYETDQCNRLQSGMECIAGLHSTRLLADWFHMNIEETDMAEAIRLVGQNIGHIHFADTNRHAIGLGHLDVHPIARALQEIGYAGYLSAEVFPLPDPLAAAKQTMVAFQQFTASLATGP